MPSQDPTETSESNDPPFQWRDRSWRGLLWHYAVLQEIDVATYTPSGTFAALAAKIPHLSDVGITALQLMPIGAPSTSLGRPEQLKALVDKAHDYGLMVLLDLMPGQATLESALSWLHEFHLDGLRVDEPLRTELTRAVRVPFSGRQIHLIPEKLASDALRVPLTGERAGEVRKLVLDLLPADGRIGKHPADWSHVSLASADAIRAATAIQLLHPQAPLLFMGEEWQSDEAFHSGRPDWSALRQPAGTAVYERYQHLLTIRRNEVSPRLPSIARSGRAELLSEHSFRIEWTVGETELLALEANLSERTGHVARKDVRRVLWAEADCAPGRALPPWSALWTIRRTG